MIDLFSLAHLSPSESLERVYRSHPLWFVTRLVTALVCFAIPFFFLFDYRGWLWVVAILCWLLGCWLMWLAFDVWSSSVVLVTSERVIGAERTAWGRVRIHDWRTSSVDQVPTWHAYPWFPWLGTLVWSHDAQRLTLAWTRLAPAVHTAQKPVTLRERRRRLVRLLKKADPLIIDRIERDIDGPEAT